MYGILRRSKAFLREELNPFLDTVLKGRIWVFLCFWKLSVFSFALNYKNRIWRNEVLSRKQELAVKNDANTAPERYTESIEWFVEGQAFLQSYDSAPPPPLSRQRVVSLFQSSCVSPVEITGVRVGSPHPPPAPLLIVFLFLSFIRTPWNNTSYLFSS